MSAAVPLSPSFVSLSTATTSDSDSLDAPATPKVRFEQECVLIPDPVPISRLPRLVTKSYSLPLWKRKRDPSVVSESEDEAPVVLKVSVPSITTKVRSPSRDAAHRPLVSCLVQAESSTSTASHAIPPHRGRPRRASLPAPVQADAVTVPLRSCCPQCYHSIDKCMKEGDHWEVHFSRGASRRRRSVSDAHTPSRSRHCVRDAMPGFDAIVAVDEVEQRRKSTEIDPLTALTAAMHIASVSPSQQMEDFPLRRALSLPDAVYPSCARVLPDLRPCALSPPILEEDELRPSPRRTPISSPLGSTTNLPSTPIVHAVRTAAVAKSAPIPISPRTPSPGPENSMLEIVDDTLSSSPPSLTPPAPVLEKEYTTSYFPAHYPGHARGISLDSPSSSPSSSPRLEHTRPGYTLDSPSAARRSPLKALPASIFRASSQVLKGISGMSGTPMSL
ncbi:hypothetical protein OH76DRAFT_1360524 [Lentinus brumalis]|uniref:Uncharacterized protein n=1 Tax=Lentinus brumalis TaxID=2498619 RepID=A0A371CUG9_9APHY|nr:hypothetical protein OH76DRAFT_1360524 [Polyporus brumalis]